MSRMTAEILRQEVNRRKTSNVFERKVMAMRGDTMANFFVAPTTVDVRKEFGTRCTCYEVRRLEPVKHVLKESLYFDTTTFEQIFPRKGVS